MAQLRSPFEKTQTTSNSRVRARSRERLPHDPIFGAHGLVRGFLMSTSASFGILQNDVPSLTVDDAPFLYLVQGAKAAEAGEIVAETAISYAGRLDGPVIVIHVDWIPCLDVFEHTTNGARSAIHHNDCQGQRRRR